MHIFMKNLSKLKLYILKLRLITNGKKKFQFFLRVAFLKAQPPIHPAGLN